MASVDETAPSSSLTILNSSTTQDRYIDEVKKLLRSGARVEDRDDDGRTTLALAAQHGHVGAPIS